MTQFMSFVKENNEEFEIDRDGKKQEWQVVPLVNFMDVDRLIGEYENKFETSER